MATLTPAGARRAAARSRALLVTTAAGADAARAAARGGARRPAIRPGSATTSRSPTWSATSPINGYHARLDRLRARRVRHPRRGDRRLPAGRRGAGAPGPVRRHPGIDPRLRPRDPALDPAAEDGRPAAGQRGAARRRRHRPLPHGLSWRPSARRATIRSTPRSARAAAAPAWSTGCRCSTTELETLFDYLPADALIGARPPGARGPRRAAGDDRRRLRGARRRPSARRTTAPLPPDALYLTADEWDAAPGRAARAAGSRPSSASRGRGVVDMGAKLGPHLRRRAGAGQRQPVRGRRRPRPRAGRGRQAGAVRLLVGGLVRAPGRHAGRPRAEGRAARALLAGGQGGRPEEAAAGGAAAGRRLRDRQPGGHLRDRHPGRPAGAAAPRAGAPPTSWPRPPALTPGDLVVHIDHGIGRYDGPEDPGGAGRAARLPGAALRRRGQALPAGREHRPAHPLRRRERGRAARPAGRRGLAGAQGQGQGAAARDGRGPDRHRRRPRHSSTSRRSIRRTACSTSSAPASPTRRPTTS